MAQDLKNTRFGTRYSNAILCHSWRSQRKRSALLPSFPSHLLRGGVASSLCSVWTTPPLHAEDERGRTEDGGGGVLVVETRRLLVDKQCYQNGYF